MRAAHVLGISVALWSHVALSGPPRPAHAHEGAALQALKRAEGDYLVMNYASGTAHLRSAFRACAPSRCTPATRAALLRDIGTMEFRAGHTGLAANAFARALALQPNIELNPSYDAPDLRAAWNEAKGGGAASPSTTAEGPSAGEPSPGPPPGVAPPPTFAQPAGDFTHVPAAEQKADTPLPIYVEGVPADATKVIVRYERSDDPEDAEWRHLDLARVSNGWGGTIPCDAISAGTIRYYIEAYDRDADPVGANGSAKTPYQVPIRSELYGPPPHLPGRAPPGACHVARSDAEPSREMPESETSDCTPGTTPGCPETGEGEAQDAETEDEQRKRHALKTPRVWVGLSYSLDFLSVPSGNNLCLLHPPSSALQAQPANDASVYCTDATNRDFPPRSLVMPGSTTDVAPVINENLAKGGQAGHSDGAYVAGTMHVSAAVDVALGANFLLGGRLGVTFLDYPGSAAAHDGHAAGAPGLYFEARLTWVAGEQPLSRPGLAPVAFVGGGYGEFDGHVTGTALFPPGSTPQPSSSVCAAGVSCGVNIWVTSGPAFGDLGGGVRYTAPGLRWALTIAARANFSFNGTGLVPSAGPDLSVTYGL